MKRLLIPCLLPISLLAACGGDDSGDDDPGELGPTYVMMTQVYTVDDRNVYFSLTDTLDVPTDELSLDDAHEYAGVANYATIGGKLYISSGEQPIITRFDVTASHAWEEEGAVSFAAYPFGDNANFFYHYIVDEETAILPYEVDKRIVWNPTEMVIEDDYDDSSMQLDDGGMLLEGGGNRAAVRFADGNAMQPFFRHDVDWLAYGPTSHVAIYDDATHEETSVLDLPCPGVEITTRAEDGTTYFSTEFYSPVRALYGEGPAPCVARVTADGELDTAWTTDFTSWTDGRYVGNFRYLRDGLAIANVVHQEDLEADFTGDYDPTVEDQLWEGGAVQVWLFDLEAETAQPVTGIDVGVGPALQSAVIDGRMFLFGVFPDYETTRIFELSEDGEATAMFDVPGDVFKWERLR